MHDPDIELPPVLLPGYGERRLAMAIIVLTLVALALLWLMILTSPAIGGMTVEPQPLVVLVPLSGIALQVVGLGWMVRIYRAAMNPEPDHGNWRYRGR